jgi:Viral BACON domain/Secretion system C-terminal sorting domain
MAADSKNIYSGSWNGGVSVSSNSGSTWTTMNNGLTAWGLYVISLESGLSYVLSGTQGNGVSLSTDDGISWSAVNTGLSGNQLFVNAITVNGAYIYAGTAGGVMKRPLTDILTLTATPASLNMNSAANSSSSFSITSNISWTLISSDTWLTPDITSGYQNATVTLTAAANTLNTSRSATVTISGGGLPNQTVTVTQDGVATGVEYPVAGNINIYPNPVHDILSVSVPGLPGLNEYFIRIISLGGREVYETEASGSEFRLNVSGWLPKGIYILQVTDRNNIPQAVRKIVVQ